MLMQWCTLSLDVRMDKLSTYQGAIYLRPQPKKSFVIFRNMRSIPKNEILKIVEAKHFRYIFILELKILWKFCKCSPWKLHLHTSWLLSWIFAFPCMTQIDAIRSEQGWIQTVMAIGRSDTPAARKPAKKILSSFLKEAGGFELFLIFHFQSYYVLSKFKSKRIFVFPQNFVKNKNETIFDETIFMYLNFLSAVGQKYLLWQ